ncbi:MAG TPA: hypothetical protein VFJ85_16490 [Acidimicrobiales bacterium]|nr:hypothetical protein [Acidimicrobiales bacterium]
MVPPAGTAAVLVAAPRVQAGAAEGIEAAGPYPGVDEVDAAPGP